MGSFFFESDSIYYFFKQKSEADMPADCQFVLDHSSGSVHCARFTHDGAYCMTAGEDKTIRLWNPHKADPRIVLPSTSQIATSSSSGPQQALCVQSYPGIHGYKVLDIAIATDKTKFASAGDDRTVYLWDVGSSRVIRRFQAHYQRTNTIMFNDDATVLFTGSYDKSVKCWDLRAQNNSRDPIETLDGSTDSITALAKTEHCILTASVDGAVRIYDLRKGCLQTDLISTDPITSLSVSDDGRMYLVACLEGSAANSDKNAPRGVVRLLDLSSGQLFREYRGHQHHSLKGEARFVPDGRQIAAGSEDGSVYHWDLLQTNVSDVTSTISLDPIVPGANIYKPGHIGKCSYLNSM